MHIRILAAIAGLSCAVLMAGCSGGNGGAPKTFDRHGVTFTYPGGWKRFSEVKSATGARPSDNRLWADGAGPTDETGVFLSAFRITLDVTPEVFERGKQELVPQFEDTLADSGGEILERGKAASYNGYPAIEVRIRPKAPEGVTTRAVFLFAGTTRYDFGCQSREKDRAEVEAGCDTVLGSFKVK